MPAPLPTIPEFFSDLLAAPGVATLSVLARDSSIQSTLVWPDFDGTYIKINTLIDSPKEKNIRRERRATILVQDKNDSDTYISLRCELHDITHDHAIEHLDMLTRRNMGVEKWYGQVEPNDPALESRRVIIFLRPVHIYHT